MQIRSGARWSAALACVFLLSGRATAAEPAAALDALREIAVRIDAATRETVAAHDEHRSVLQNAVDAAKRARGELDAVSRTAAAQGIANESSFERKRRLVGQQLANLERAQAASEDAVLPKLAATTDPQHTARLALSAERGATCAAALTIAPGFAIETNLAAHGDANSTLWLRVAPGTQGVTRLDTAPTPLDTEITLFGARCPSSDAEAIGQSDDSFGLAASVAFDGRSGAHYARVRNLGRAGHVVARADTAAAVVGRITDARNGHSLGATVEAVTLDGYSINAVYADSETGLYLLTVDPGSYYVVAEASYGGPSAYVTELYPDAPCSSSYFYQLSECDVAHATLLVLSDSQQVSGINVALNVGGRLSGVVRDEFTGAPIEGADVTVYDTSGWAVSYFNNTDAAGRYMVSGLLTGEYYVIANGEGFGSQMWDHIDCDNSSGNYCNPLDGTPIAVVRDALRDRIDFELMPMAHIRVTVTPRDDAGIPLTFWTLTLYNQSGDYVGQFNGYDTPTLDAGPLQPGSYRAFVTASGFFGQVWSGIDCMTDCLNEVAQGELITVGEGGEADIAFSLLSMPTVSGVITDAQTHAPIANAEVALVPVDQSWATVTGYTDAGGHFMMSPYLIGSYYVWAWDTLHRGTVYPSAACSNRDFSTCDLASATPVTIAYGGSSITDADIAMPVDGSMTGRLTVRVPDGVTPMDVIPFFARVSVSDASGYYAGTGYVDVNGDYVVPGLPAGTYHAVASSDGFDQLYDGIDCQPGCDPAGGTPIVLAQGQNVTGIDFDPMPSEYIFGRATDGSGAGIAGIAIDLWGIDGTLHCGVAATNAQGYYAVRSNSFQCESGLIVSTDVDPAHYMNQIYDGVLCPAGSLYLGLCSVDGATEVSLPSTPVFVTANFVLGQRPEAIFASGFDP